MTLLSIIVSAAIAFALAGVAVRIQYSLFRGFDFAVAFTVVLSAESFTAASRAFTSTPIVGLVICSAFGIGVAIVAVVAWNSAIHYLWLAHSRLGMALLVCSLGVSTAASGFVGLVRGPGLRQPSWLLNQAQVFPDSTIGLPALYAITCGGTVVILVVLWASRRTGLALDLWAQNQDFAREIGIDRATLAPVCGVVTGLASGAVGCYFALAGGSTPEGGLSAFLYGAGAALLLPAPTLNATVLGGLILGTIYVIVQLIFNQSIADLILFAIVAALLLRRGTSRTVQGAR
jgi:branched-subunit amino acid ABC-type transport system permease component